VVEKIVENYPGGMMCEVLGFCRDFVGWEILEKNGRKNLRHPGPSSGGRLI